jgi:hypothetical protein
VSSSRQLHLIGPVNLITVGVAAGVAFGAMLGAIAMKADPLVVCVLITMGGLVALTGVIRGNRPWQLDSETSGAWLRYQDWRTLVFNGSALGVGFVTRIGFWAWYIVPLTALAFRDPVIGAAMFAVYAGTRLALSAFVTPHMRPGRLSSRREQFARLLDPAAGFLCCAVIATAWLDTLAS